MLRLPHYFYTPVSFENVEISFEFINEDFLPDLKKNASFVAFVKSKINDVRFFLVEERLKEFEESEFFNQDTPLEELGIKSILPKDTIMLTADVCEYFNAPWVVTDRYFYPYGFRHIGSSRHALLYTTQLKGIGRNNLAHRADYTHAWGGFALGQALTGLVANIYIDQVTPLGSLPVWAIARLNNWVMPQDSMSPCILFRDARAYRLAHFEVGSNANEKIVSAINNQLMDFHQTNDIKTIRSRVLKQFVTYLEKGINSRSSVIPENLLFDGRAIDTEEYEIFITKKPVITISVDLKEHFTKDEVKVLDSKTVFEVILQKGLKVYCDNISRVFTSWYIYALILEESLTGIRPSMDELKNDFFNALKGTEINEDEVDLYKHFLEEFTESMRLQLKPRPLSENFLKKLESMHLLDETRYEIQEDKYIFNLHFSRDKHAKNIKGLLSKVLSLVALNKNKKGDAGEGLSNYINLKNIILNMIKSL